MKKLWKNKKGAMSIQYILIMAVILGLLIWFAAPRIIEVINGTRDGTINGIENSYTGSESDLFVGNDLKPGSTDTKPPSLHSNLITRTVKVTDDGTTKTSKLIDAYINATFQDKSGIDYIRVYKSFLMTNANLVKDINKGSQLTKLKVTTEGTYMIDVADRLYGIKNEDGSLAYPNNRKQYQASIKKEEIPIDVYISNNENGKVTFKIRRVGTKTIVRNLKVEYSPIGSSNVISTIENKTLGEVNLQDYVLNVDRPGVYILTVTDNVGNVFIYEYTVASYAPELDLGNSYVYGKVKMKPDNLAKSDVITAKWMVGQKDLEEMKNPNNGTPMQYLENGYSNTNYVDSGTTITMYFETKYYDIVYHVKTEYSSDYTPGLAEEISEVEKAKNTITHTIIQMK